jgi:cytoskeletal protein CcmA (bactofilin family)
MKANKSTAVSAFLGVDTDFEGRLTFNGNLRIDGRFKGEIAALGGLVIGQKAIVKADIHTTDVTISGEVSGKINADQRIEINATGKVFGDIQSPSIIVYPGAVFEGNCLTSKPQPLKEEIIMALDENTL